MGVLAIAMAFVVIYFTNTLGFAIPFFGLGISALLFPEDHLIETIEKAAWMCFIFLAAWTLLWFTNGPESQFSPTLTDIRHGALGAIISAMMGSWCTFQLRLKPRLQKARRRRNVRLIQG
jgi:hypothetical protein